MGENLACHLLADSGQLLTLRVQPLRLYGELASEHYSEDRADSVGECVHSNRGSHWRASRQPTSLRCP